MSDVLVYATESRARTARTLLGAACRAMGISARLELYGTGSLYQRLGPRRSQPLPDIVMWFGPFAACAATMDGLLQPYQPAQVADAAPHDPNWAWTTLDYCAIRVVGTPSVMGFEDLATAPRLAMADPERSEVGMGILLAMLDRARQVDGDPEHGWLWWRERVRRGVLLAEDDASAVASVGAGGVTHALSMADSATPVSGLAPVPNAVGLAASSRNVEGARVLLDWMTGPAAAPALRLSPWQPESKELQALLTAAPALDVNWARQQYTAARRRWGESGFGPSVEG
jgi:ABC-type Fe3+ transport system substrate-binding protein